jgi:DNA helicase-2/ATP-dependent DNA helicase PcrA
MTAFLESIKLNEPQLEAVKQTEGPLLVLAGAGTGKTRVLTTRIVNIIESGLAYPSEILAVTFTNKAAREMQNRISELLSNSHFAGAGTFHSISARILRRYAGYVDMSPSFTIIDQDDQLKVIKGIYDELGIDKKEIPPKIVQHIISRWKDMGLWYDQISNSDLKSESHTLAKKIYPVYQQKINSSNLCDFGDLLLYNIRIFFSNPEVLEKLQNTYKYILIDEYQDTNAVQYLWARMLADKHKNICCVGDDDQSIYSWRGAEVANILRFEKDFEGAKIIALEQNYRSTPHILNAASALIQNNPTRHSKTLWTQAENGEKIDLVSCYNEKEEAKFISNYVMNSLIKEKASQMSILVRAGFQTRSFEEAFINSGIQYRIVGGLRFYERAEIKDIIAYVRLLINSNDDVAFERVINTPKRSIGPSALKNIKDFALSNNISYFDSISKMLEESLFKNKQSIEISNFKNLINKFREDITSPHSTSDILKNLVSESGYKDMLKLEKTDESRARLENINELIRAVGEYESLQDFLEHASLVMDNDSETDEIDKVNIMTLHAAKGLEFNLVFMPGMEEGLFPNQKSLNEEGTKGLEEERRIAYVGITRAKKKLIMLHAENRRIFNEFLNSIPSRFIAEIPDECFNKSSSTNFYNKINHSTKTYRKPNISSDIRGNDPIRPGARVEHKSFGKGIILKKSLDNLEIFFDSKGIKTIKQDYITLTQ